jgi:hypothetical protein
MDVTGVSGAIDSLAEVKTGDAIESGVLVADSAAIRFDFRVTMTPDLSLVEGKPWND